MLRTLNVRCAVRTICANETKSTVHEAPKSPLAWVGGSVECPASGEALEPVDWARLLPFSLWIYGGFGGFGAIAGRIANPARNVPLVLWTLVAVCIIINTMPYIISLSVVPVFLSLRTRPTKRIYSSQLTS